MDIRRKPHETVIVNKMEMINKDTEEFLSTLSDSEASSDSSKSLDLSPQSSSLTLEQFTDIVLAQEKLDASNSESDIPVTVDEIVEKSSDSIPRQVILPLAKPPTSQSYSHIQPRKTTLGEKLKPVVLTPRQVHIPKVASPPGPMNNRLGPKTLKIIPNLNPCNSISPTDRKNTIKNKLPLYESIFSLAGSPGTPKYDQTHITEQLLRSTKPDQRISDQMRKQLEIFIRRNEEILGNTDMRKHDLVKKRDKTGLLDNMVNSTPLNLSVRKDLMKSSSNESIMEKEKKKHQSRPRDLSTALASLIAKTGGDLEITRKVKKANPSSRSYIYDKPPIVNMTPIYQHREKDMYVPAMEELDRGMGKRKASQLGESIEENVKKIKSLITENLPKNTVKTEPVLTNCMNIKQENSAVVNKILTDCKLALHQDLHGNL